MVSSHSRYTPVRQVPQFNCEDLFAGDTTRPRKIGYMLHTSASVMGGRAICSLPLLVHLNESDGLTSANSRSAVYELRR
jgi:hypothetical protein